MDEEITVTQGKRQFCDLIERAGNGERFVITNHGRPVARIIPVGRPSQQDIRDAVIRMRAQRKGRSLDGITWEEIKNEGRRF
jgi:prevent-host-death family protein